MIAVIIEEFVESTLLYYGVLPSENLIFRYTFIAILVFVMYQIYAKKFPHKVALRKQNQKLKKELKAKNASTSQKLINEQIAKEKKFKSKD